MTRTRQTTTTKEIPVANTPPAKKAASKSTETAGESTKPAHLLAAVSPDGDITDLEYFTGEMAARRALDDRGPDWRYLKLRPGVPHRARGEVQS